MWPTNQVRLRWKRTGKCESAPIIAKNSPRLFWIGVPDRITRRKHDKLPSAFAVLVPEDFSL